MSERCLLSILIPSYCYPDGIEKILTCLIAAGRDCRVEYVISDDSPDNKVQAVFEKYINEFSRIRYTKNSPSLGAVKNWNSMIDRANGEYVLLMHHDEFPIKTTFVSELLEFIESNKGADLIFLKCFLVNEKNVKRLHATNILKFYILKYFLPFILTKNIVGPTSAMCFNKKLAEPFDENLTWFVDTDFYYRIISNAKKPMCSEISIGSTLNRIQSITNGIKSQINFIRNNEISYLSKKYPNQRLWLKFRIVNFYFLVLVFVWGVTRIFGGVVRSPINFLRMFLKRPSSYFNK